MKQTPLHYPHKDMSACLSLCGSCTQAIHQLSHRACISNTRKAPGRTVRPIQSPKYDRSTPITKSAITSPNHDRTTSDAGEPTNRESSSSAATDCCIDWTPTPGHSQRSPDSNWQFSYRSTPRYLCSKCGFQGKLKRTYAVICPGCFEVL